MIIEINPSIPTRFKAGLSRFAFYKTQVDQAPRSTSRKSLISIHRFYFVINRVNKIHQ